MNVCLYVLNAHDCEWLSKQSSKVEKEQRSNNNMEAENNRVECVIYKQQQQQKV